MRWKLVLLITASSGLFSLSQSSLADWEPGPCPGSGTAPCIEYNGMHFNGDGGHAGIWHGPDGDAPASQPGGDRTNTFEFCGDTVLTCGSAVVECNLCLYGQVEKCQDANSDWHVRIRVLDGVPNAGDFTCAFISLGGFPWYIDQNSDHGPYTDTCDVGIPYDASSTPPINLVGSIGDIDISVPLLGINVTNGHMHGVTYNNVSSFFFGTTPPNDIIYINGAADDPSGCTVESIAADGLRLQPIGDTLSIQ